MSTTNIHTLSLENDNFRKVIDTKTKMQLVIMSIDINDDIPLEIHDDHDQFIRVESGTATVSLGTKEVTIKENEYIIIPAGTWHRVKNIGNSKLKLSTIYSPPEHPPNRIDIKKPIENQNGGAKKKYIKYKVLYHNATNWDEIK
jgi:mannose-6-phosphate isomerase-like protein (cupin superfamily)